MGKAFIYRRFFRRMKRFGLFKAVVCDGTGEYGFPFLPEKHRAAKRAVLFLLVSALFYLVSEPPHIGTGPVFLDPAPQLDEKVDPSGMTGLHRAVIRGAKNIIALWLRKGADPDKPDRYGWTPLHWARFLGREDLAEILVRAGAGENIPSTSDWYLYPGGSRPADVRGPF